MTEIISLNLLYPAICSIYMLYLVKNGDSLLHEILTYINVYITKVGMSQSLLLIFCLIPWND